MVRFERDKRIRSILLADANAEASRGQVDHSLHRVDGDVVLDDTLIEGRAELGGGDVIGGKVP